MNDLSFTRHGQSFAIQLDYGNGQNYASTNESFGDYEVCGARQKPDEVRAVRMACEEFNRQKGAVKDKRALLSLICQTYGIKASKLCRVLNLKIDENYKRTKSPKSCKTRQIARKKASN